MFVAIYFILSPIVTSIFAGVMSTGRPDDRFEIGQPEDAIAMCIFMLCWIIAVPTIGTLIYMRSRKDRIQDKCSNIVSKYNLEKMSPHDRSAMIEIPENELKYILKWHRKKVNSLNKTTLEMVRDELMHRNAERELLR